MCTHMLIWTYARASCEKKAWSDLERVHDNPNSNRAAINSRFKQKILMLAGKHDRSTMLDIITDYLLLIDGSEVFRSTYTTLSTVPECSHDLIQL